LSKRQEKVGSIVTFRFPVRVETSNNDSLVGLFGELDGILNSLIRREDGESTDSNTLDREGSDWSTLDMARLSGIVESSDIVFLISADRETLTTYLSLLNFDTTLDLDGSTAKVCFSSDLILRVVDDQFVIDPQPSLASDGETELVLSVDGGSELGFELGEPVISESRREEVGQEHVTLIPDLIIARLGSLLAILELVVVQVESLLAVNGSEILVELRKELGTSTTETVFKLDTRRLVIL
jgi:hypothetical protein